MTEQRTKEQITYPFQGKRVELIPQPGGFQLLKPGEYGRWSDGTWYACTPNGHGCNLAAHHVTEHDDSTISVSHDKSITVSPSILITERRGNVDVELWHGWLERGMWRLA